MKKTIARWDCELWVDCPYCDEFQGIKYLEMEEWWYTFSIAKSEKVEGYIHTCQECGKEFEVEATEW